MVVATGLCKYGLAIRFFSPWKAKMNSSGIARLDQKQPRRRRKKEKKNKNKNKNGSAQHGMEMTGTPRIPHVSNRTVRFLTGIETNVAVLPRG